MAFQRAALTLAFICLQAIPVRAETVRIAHPAQLAPFIFVLDGKTVGLVADILRAAAAREDIDIVFVAESPAELRETLTNGTADAIAPSVIAPERYDFTTAFVVTGGALFVRAPHPTPARLEELSGKTVVTPEGGPFANYFHENFPSVNLVLTNKSTMTDEYLESLDRVISGQADAAALNIREGARVVGESYPGKITVPTAMFLRLSLGLAVTKGQHADIIRRLDAGLAAIGADGTLQRIENQWVNR